MRIITGRFRGRRLKAFSGDHLRPTTDRVKESLFNKLMTHFPGAHVLDLFAGTGNLSIEALSRGAERVVAVEKNPKSLRIIKDNLKAIDIEHEVQVHPIDVFRFLKDVAPRSFDVVLADPPFTQKIAHEVMQAISDSDVLLPGGRVAIESSQQERIDDGYGPLVLLDRKNFGDKSLSFFVDKERE